MNPRTLLFALCCLGFTLQAQDRTYPESAAVIDVTKAPYSAKGDGVTDDSEAIQRAVNEHVGRSRILYFPSGIYLISKTIMWPKKWEGRENWGFTKLHGQNRDRTVLRLKDGVFTDPKKPEAMMWCGGFGSADWFHNYIENLTFDAGAGNPGATALQFYSNNTGAVRDCRFIAPEGSGVVGLDLAHRDMNGPLLVQNCEVIGFERGIASSRAVNSQCFEKIQFRGQRRVGFQNEGQAISIRGLHSENSVPAVSTYGSLLLIEAKLTGTGNAAKAPAIVNFNGGRIFLRDVKTTGYSRALADLKTPDFGAAFRISGEDKPGSLGPSITEYCSHAATSPFPSPGKSLRLAIKETPTVPWDPPATWANVDNLGADPQGKEDSAAAIQKAIDSGATTVFLPGNYQVSKPIIVRGKVRRILGTGAWVDYNGRTKPDFRVVDGEAPVVVFEHIATINGGVEIETDRTVVFRSLGPRTVVSKRKGDVFFEDVTTGNLHFSRQNVWGRQLNVENEGTHITNDGGKLWILGYKTERGGTLVDTRSGGFSEILGGFSYTTTASQLAPMFVNTDSSVFTFFTEVCYNNDPFLVKISETRKGETRAVGKEEGHTAPYSGYPSAR